MNTGVTVRITDAVVVRVGESAVRVVDAPTNTVVAIGSSNAGPVGPQGATGSQGAQGVTGAASTVPGPQGNQGAAGAQGNQGSAGAQGAAGSQGAPGPQGNQGAAGAQGNQGSAGAQGAAGAQGNQGSAGAQGAQGNQGAQGATGSSPFTVNSVDVTAANSTSTPMSVSGAAGQTADLLQFKNSSGTVVTSVSGGGIVKVNGGSGSEISLYADGGGGLFLFGTTSDSGAYADMGARNSALEVNAKNRPTRYVRTDDGTVMQVRGMATQTANLQEWQDSSGTILARVTSSGEVVAALIDGGSA